MTMRVFRGLGGSNTIKEECSGVRMARTQVLALPLN